MQINIKLKLVTKLKNKNIIERIKEIKANNLKYFLPDTSSSLHKYANKYPAGKANTNINIINNIPSMIRLSLPGF